MSGEAYDIEFRWKEEVIYWEGDVGFVFDGGWGVEPSVTYVPDEPTWDGVVPAWMQGRRDEIVGRLAGRPGHILTPTPDYDHDESRSVRRSNG